MLQHAPMSFFKKFFSKEKEKDLEQGLEKTKEGLLGKIARVFTGKSKIDQEVLDEVETILIQADVGLETTVKIINRIEKRVSRDKYTSMDELSRLLREEISGLLSEHTAVEWDDYEVPIASRPYVVLVVGVNGVGKTTSIGKIAHQYQSKGYKVVLGAADTFRAAAVDQLEIWADRVGCDFFSKGMGADPAAVAFEAVQHGVRTGADVVIIDTAGRLHNKAGLMAELGKIRRSVDKALPGAPHDALLVLDATTGQNAFEQCRHFSDVTQITGLILTKLDGTAKGGVAIGISDQYRIPIRFIGVGEAMNQLQIFNRQAFVNALFEKSNASL
jgi:fused signal recognition particle receptor